MQFSLQPWLDNHSNQKQTVQRGAHWSGDRMDRRPTPQGRATWNTNTNRLEEDIWGIAAIQSAKMNAQKHKHY